MQKSNRTQKNIREYFNEYIRLCHYSKGLRPATIRGYEATAKVFFEIMPEVQTPDDLAEENITLFLERLKKRSRIVGKGKVVNGIKQSTANTYRSKLDAFFKWLEAKEIIMNSPFKHISKPRVEYVDRREVFRKDFEKIISTIRLESQNPLLMRRNLAIIYLLFYCGLRRGEIVGLLVMDLDMDKRMLTIRGETSKSKATRQVPLNPNVVLYLEDYLLERRKRNYKTSSLFVSGNEDTGLSIFGYVHLVRTLVKKSGVQFHLHKLRHTFASNLVRGKVDVYAIQRLLGHTDIRMTQKYLRSTTAEDFRSAVDKLSIENMA